MDNIALYKKILFAVADEFPDNEAHIIGPGLDIQNIKLSRSKNEVFAITQFDFEIALPLHNISYISAVGNCVEIHIGG